MNTPFLSFLFIALSLARADLTAKIVSCSGWALNRLKNVKTFLKGNDGVITYRNVEVEYIRGKKPVMTIMNDGEEVESIELKNFDASVEGLHALFKEKGFERISGKELEEALEKRSKIDADREVEERRKKEENKKRREKMEMKKDDPEAMENFEKELKELINSKKKGEAVTPDKETEEKIMEWILEEAKKQKETTGDEL